MSVRRHLMVFTHAPERAASAAAATVAVGASRVGVCCVLPLALPAVVVALSGGAIAVFAIWLWRRSGPELSRTYHPL